MWGTPLHKTFWIAKKPVKVSAKKWIGRFSFQFCLRLFICLGILHRYIQCIATRKSKILSVFLFLFVSVFSWECGENVACGLSHALRIAPRTLQRAARWPAVTSLSLYSLPSDKLAPQWPFNSRKSPAIGDVMNKFEVLGIVGEGKLHLSIFFHMVFIEFFSRKKEIDWSAHWSSGPTASENHLSPGWQRICVCSKEKPASEF